MDYEMKLNEMAYANVLRGECPLPTPTIEEQIVAKRDELKLYKSKDFVRPQPKSEYFSLLENTKSEIEILETQNADILEQNEVARKVVNDKYLMDIEAYKSDINNVWDAIRAVRDDLLTQCDWTQIPDSPKANQQVWLDYRQALRDITLQEDPYNLVWPTKPCIDTII